jgi:hypothetical protein
MSLMKPRKLVEITDNKTDVVVDENTNYIFGGKIWSWLRIGCMVCMAEDEEDLQFQSFKSQDDECYCMTHGNLTQVQYRTERAWSVTVDGITRTGMATRESVIHIPVEYNEAQKSELLEEIFSEYKALEEEFD